MTPYQQFIALRSYARYLPDLRRRETWPETVARYCDFWQERFPDSFPHDEVLAAVTAMEVMPSMRCLMTAGPALDINNVAGYNCAFLNLDDPRAFDELLYILMCGTGCGFSVERQVIARLPAVADKFRKMETTIEVEDSREGWQRAFRDLLYLLWGGFEPRWDLSRLRPAGAMLRTFGGRSSGPGPLDDLFKFAVSIFRGAAGRRLESIECHDLACKIGEVVVSGGVRRSALISLSNLSDLRMREAKYGQFWQSAPHRAMANNSVAYTERPELGAFIDEWRSLYTSKSGERGIFNRAAAVAKGASFGDVDGPAPALVPRVLPPDCGTNPCGEIALRSGQFCNLSEVVVRPEDDWPELASKVRLATILGTFQATLTDFPHLRPHWTRNTREEALLGVSMTGVMDNPVLARTDAMAADMLKDLRALAHATNREWAERLGINPSAAVTCVKPSGTVSQLVDSASGLHDRHSTFYVRTVRSDAMDPLSIWMQERGVPCEPDVVRPGHLVFSFPQRAPSPVRHRGAVAQLDHWRMFARHWADHNPSVTVSVAEHEWLDVAAWVWRHWDEANGLAFLPKSDHVYRQAPYQEITGQEYAAMMETFPVVDLSQYAQDEMTDHGEGSRTFACVGGSCEV